MSEKPSRVREPIQVYLDSRDRNLLDRLASDANLSRAEILRMGLRKLGSEVAGTAIGGSLRAMVGAIDAADTPPDLAARHDDYLYPAPTKANKRTRKPR